MRTAKLRLVRERMIRAVHEYGASPSTIQTDLDRLDGWEQTLLNHAEKCRDIQNSPRLTQRGKGDDIAVEVSKVIKQLAAEENTLAAIAKGVEALDAAIINAVAIARGKARVLDPSSSLIEELQRQEIRSLWRHQQAVAEQDHQKYLANAKKIGMSLDDEERQRPDVTKKQFLNACKSFNENVDKNRLLVNAVMQSPVPLLDDEALQEGEKLLKQSVAAEQLEQRQAALARADAIGILLRCLEDVARNPLSLTLIQEPHTPVSDQDRLKAAA